MQKPAESHFFSLLEYLMRIVDLLGLFIAMYLSELLVENIVFGGAVYIAGEVWVNYVRLFNKRNLHLLPSNIRARGLFVFVLAGLLTAALVVFFPYIQSKPTSLVLILLIGGFILQQIVTDMAAKKLSSKNRRMRGFWLALCHFVFLLALVLLFYLNQLVLQYPAPVEISAVLLCTVCVSLLLYGCQVYDPPEPAEEQTPADLALDGDTLMQVHSYRIYNKMTVNTVFAINLSITAFICYMRFLPYGGFIHSILMLSIWLAFIALVTTAGFWLLNKRYAHRQDRHAIFFAGLLFWLFAMFGSLNAWWRDTFYGSIVNVAAMGMSLSCMLSIILVQSYEMKTVIELGVGHIDRGAYARNTNTMLNWSMLTSYLLLLVMLCISSFVMDGKFGQMTAMQGMQSVLRVVMLVLPMVFVLISLVYSLMQPLDRNYAEKLKKYNRLVAEGKTDPPLENRLKKILVSNYPRQLAVILIKPLLRPFLPCKIVGKEHVDLSQGPAIFICNHLEIYGPLIAVLYSPFPVRPWVIHSMLEPEIIVEHMQPGVDKTLAWFPARWRRGLTRRVAPILIWILQSTDPIPVYRGTVRALIQTIQSSAEALEYDDNILLFPETDYQPEGVGTLFSGFVQVGKTYYRQSGKCVTFYPLYINKKEKCMSFQRGVTFDPANDNYEEKERIVNYLQNTMNEMAGVGVPQAATASGQSFEA